MHPTVQAAFANVLEVHPPPGPRALEIGVNADPNRSLLGLLDAGTERIGINMAPLDQVADYELMQMNGNDMSKFDDDRFDVVFCNATLEHDRHFWLTIAEVQRVLAPGGRFYVGVPGYPRRANVASKAAAKARSTPLARIPPLKKLAREYSAPFAATFGYHSAPEDYYRFSEDAVRNVFLEGMTCESLEYVGHPVRIVAVGTHA